MKCPIDQTELLTTERQGVEIDHCPKCRGVWLDRGELERLIELSAHGTLSMNRGHGRQRTRYGASAYTESYDRKRKSLLGELFDF